MKRRPHKKGMEPIQLIVTAVVALVILVIILAIFSGRFTRFRSGIEEQEQAGISLQDWFAGYGCQPIPNACRTVTPTGNTDTEKTTFCQQRGCTFVTGQSTCSGDSSSCRAATTQQACQPLVSQNLCRWIQKPQ